MIQKPPSGVYKYQKEVFLISETTGSAGGGTP